jgi:hypothetical protein
MIRRPLDLHISRQSGGVSLPNIHGARDHDLAMISGDHPAPSADPLQGMLTSYNGIGPLKEILQRNFFRWALTGC